jgi:hypothetical protein
MGEEPVLDVQGRKVSSEAVDDKVCAVHKAVVVAGGWNAGGWAGRGAAATAACRQQTETPQRRHSVDNPDDTVIMAAATWRRHE